MCGFRGSCLTRLSMIDSTSTSGGRRASTATVPLAVLAGLSEIALVLSAFGESRLRGVTTLLAVLGTLVGLPLLILVMVLPILGPQLRRNRLLRLRFPAATVLTSQKAGLDEALAALGVTPGQVTSTDAAPQFFGVVFDDHEVSVWFGTREPVKVAQFARASISDAVVARRQRFTGQSWALVLQIVGDVGSVDLSAHPENPGVAWGVPDVESRTGSAGSIADRRFGLAARVRAESVVSDLREGCRS